MQRPSIVSLVIRWQYDFAYAGALIVLGEIINAILAEDLFKGSAHSGSRLSW